MKFNKTLVPDPFGGGDLALLLAGKGKDVFLRSVSSGGKRIPFEAGRLPARGDDTFLVGQISAAKAAGFVFTREGLPGIGVKAGVYDAVFSVDGKDLPAKIEVKDTVMDPPAEEDIDLARRRGLEGEVQRLLKMKAECQKELERRVVVS